MHVELLTHSDLQQFKVELLAEIRKMVSPTVKEQAGYLKSKEVKKLLQISDSTLQFFRNSGKVDAKKIGGVYYYSRTSVLKLFEDG